VSEIETLLAQARDSVRAARGIASIDCTLGAPGRVPWPELTESWRLPRSSFFRIAERGTGTLCCMTREPFPSSLGP